MADAWVTNIELNRAQEPTEVTVVMSIDVAAFLVQHFGDMPAVADGSAPIYDCLTGSVFNAFWHDGVDGYFTGRADR